MAARVPFQVKTALAILVAVCFLTAVGYLAYQRLIRIVASAEDAAQAPPQPQLVRDIASGLSDAGEGVRSWSLSGDPFYLEKYADLKSSITEKAEVLVSLETPAEYYPHVLRLDTLVRAKWVVLDSLLNLGSLNHVSVALDQFSDKIISIQPGGKGLPASKDGSSATGKDKPVKPSQLSAIQDEIIRKGEAGEGQLEQLTEQQQHLFRRDQALSAKVRHVLFEVEKLETKAMIRHGITVKKTADETRWLILLFCIVMVPLLLLLGVGILDYTRKNNAYRRAMHAAKGEAEKLASVRERFLADMSHEIRTPLNAISGFMQQIKVAGLSEAQLDQFEIVQQSADHLLQVVNSILDHARLESGKITLGKTGFAPAESALLIAELWKTEAVKKNLSFSLLLDPGLPPVVLGDEMRFRQIILNLLSNAVRFTHKGGITLSLAPSPRGITITVADTGIGIPADKQESIFLEYEQSDESISRRYGGTGLGLAITRKLVNLHGGSISLESEPGKGTTVTVELPLNTGSAADLPQVGDDLPPDAPDLLGGKRVLIADDEKYNRMLLISILSRWGMSCGEATTGTESLQKLREEKWDFALLDIRMPEMSGAAVCMEIRKDKEGINASIPFIAVTAAQQDEASPGRYAGFSAVIYKPFREEVLITRLLSAVQPVIPDRKVNFGALSGLVRDDAVFARELAATFIGSLAEGSSEMKKAAEAGNWSLVGEWAHRLAPPSLHLEATGLWKQLKALEKAVSVPGNETLLRQLLSQLLQEADAVTGELKVQINR